MPDVPTAHSPLGRKVRDGQDVTLGIGEAVVEVSEFLKIGLPRLLGLTVTVAEPDRVTAELVVSEEHSTLGHTVHGGTVMALADTLGAIGTVLNLRDGQSTTTVESKTNFFGGAPVGSKLLAESTPLHRGRRTQVWETRLTNESGRLVAKVTQTQLVL